MGIPMGARRYHSHKRAAQKAAAQQAAIEYAASDPRPICPNCGRHFQPTADGRHYVVGRIPCNWRQEVEQR